MEHGLMPTLHGKAEALIGTSVYIQAQPCYNRGMQLKEFPNYSVDKEGFISNTKGKLLKPVERNGYLAIRLSKNNKVYHKSVHRLVYEAFKGTISEGYHINHINGLRNDNRLNNLEACTHKENNDRRLFLRKGEQINTAKLTEQQVMDIRKRKQKGESTMVIAKEYGLNKSSINKIVRGYSWKHLPILDVDKSYWGNPKLTGKLSGKILNDKYGKDYFAKIATGNKFKKHCESCRCADAFR